MTRGCDSAAQLRELVLFVILVIQSVAMLVHPFDEEVDEVPLRRRASTVQSPTRLRRNRITKAGLSARLQLDDEGKNAALSPPQQRVVDELMKSDGLFVDVASAAQNLGVKINSIRVTLARAAKQLNTPKVSKFFSLSDRLLVSAHWDSLAATRFHKVAELVVDKKCWPHDHQEFASMLGFTPSGARQVLYVFRKHLAALEDASTLGILLPSASTSSGMPST